MKLSVVFESVIFGWTFRYETRNVVSASLMLYLHRSNINDSQFFFFQFFLLVIFKMILKRVKFLYLVVNLY